MIDILIIISSAASTKIRVMDFHTDKKKKEKVVIDLEDSGSDEPREIAPNGYGWEKVVKKEQNNKKVPSLPTPELLPPPPMMAPVSVVIRDEKEQARIAQANRLFEERRSLKIAERKLMEELKEQFGYYIYLPKESLLIIREQLKIYALRNDTAKSKENKIYALRFQNRQKLLKFSLLGRAQMKFREIKPINCIENYLLRAGKDCYKYILTQVEALEQHLFCSLYDSYTIHCGRYPSQIKNFIMHLQDDVNFKLRRRFLNKTLTFSWIADTCIDDMTTDEENERYLMKMRKIINQSTDVAKHLKATFEKQEEEAERKRNDPNYVPYKPPEESEEHKKERLMELRIYFNRVTAVKNKLKDSRRNMRIRIEKVEGAWGQKLMRAFRETLPMIE